MYAAAVVTKRDTRYFGADAATRFDIGSITKTFTAMGVLLAQHDRNFDVDVPLTQQGARIELHDPAVLAALTASDVLTHRSGLPPHDLLWYFGAPPVADLAQRLRHLDLIPGAFRHAFVYNNLLYATLGVAMAEALGEQWERYVTSRLLEPLGMSGTTFDAHSNAAAVPAAGGLRSTPADLAIWMRAHLHGGFLPPRSVALVHERHTRIQQPPLALSFGLEWLTRELSYGYGWFIAQAYDRTFVFHPGLVEGYSNAMILVPEDGVGVVVLTDETGSTAAAVMAHELICEALDVQSPRSSLTRTAAATQAAATLGRPEVTGTYEHAAYGQLHVSETGETLQYRDAEWRLQWHTPLTATFAVSALGMRFDMPLAVTQHGMALDIPLAMDPRVPPINFWRTAGV